MTPILPTTADRRRPVTDPAPAAPAVTVLDAVEAPRAAVLVLHGGKEHSPERVTARGLSWQRGAALGRALARGLRAEHVAVRLLRYRSIGWNGDGADKVADARWALEVLGEELGDVPTVLVGHSMGGRAACQVA